MERVRSLLVTLSERGSCSLKEISATSGLAISTSSRLLDSLEHHGFVERERETKRYQLGPMLFRLGDSSKPRRNLVSTIHPILKWLTHDTGEDAGLAELHGTHAVIIDRVEGRHPLKIIDVIGKLEPLNCGAFRKVLLSFQNDAWIESYIKTLTFERFTPRTITTASRLWREISRIRKLGYATSYGERLRDAGGIAAPVFDFTGNIKAAIQIVLPVVRMKPSTTRKYIGAVVRTAQEATALLGGRVYAVSPMPGRKAGPSKSRRVRI